MGGCATKPKELKTEAPAPEPEPAPAKEEAAGMVSEAKEVVVAEELKIVQGETVVYKEKEIVDDDTVDDHGNKRRSLSNLFKENQGKDSSESDPVKDEEPSVNLKLTDISETKPHEPGKTETPVEQTPRDLVVEVPVEAKAEKAVEIEPTTGTLAEKGIESPAAMEMQKPEEKKIVEEAVETQKFETPEEKKIVEEKPATVTQKSETPEEKNTEEEK